MPAELSHLTPEAISRKGPPRCVFVTGPPGAGKTRWLKAQIEDLVGNQPGVRCAVLLAEEGRTRFVPPAQDTPGVTVRTLRLPCPCCPALGDLPGALQALVADVQPDCLFVEVPVLAASGLLGDFDRVLGWPREVVVCLDRTWGRALQEQGLSPFHSVVLELADRVVATPIPGGVHGALVRSGASAEAEIVPR